MPTSLFNVGGASIPGGIAGVLAINTTPVLTGANTTETDLFSYTVPANAFSGSQDVIRILAGGAFGATDNDKTLRLKVQTAAGPTFTTVHTFAEANLASGHLNGSGWSFDIILLGTVTLLTCYSTLDIAAESSVTVATPMRSTGSAPGQAIDNTASMIIKVTGQNGTAAADDILFGLGIVQYLSSPS